MLKDVGVDTLYLIAKLTEDQIEEVKNNIDFRTFNMLWNGNSVWKYMLYNKDPFFMVYFEPRAGTGLWTRQHYNIMIYMQREAIETKPAVLRLLMSIGEWRVKRVDIAYDWEMPMSKHFTLASSNVKQETFTDNQNYYLYGRRNQLRVAVYDKKQQLQATKGISIPEDHLIRLEVRINPSLKNQIDLTQDLTWLKKYLDRVVFVTDASAVSRALTKSEDKQAFRTIRRRTQLYWQGIDEPTRKRIRKTVKEFAVDLYELLKHHHIEKDIIWEETE